ncbi:MAG: hypothetical protein COT90_02150 [Candidatus Diapherotrites archaeon CG10_big_fil_rev_8_21_14_0_10_31_34]|nr:MAG: hypothetical protein COT90_02150 [Candidatus Diapherotrites archaeon CG10_big_fil_rev_8_21_14_0_10_31_34]
MEKEYKVIESYKELPERIKKELETSWGFEKKKVNISRTKKLLNSSMIDTFKKLKFRAILKENQLIAFVSFNPSKKNCFINYLWQNPRDAVVYRKQKGISPAKKLIKYLIEKKGFTEFNYDVLSSKGRQMVKELKKKELIKKKFFHRIEITKKGVKHFNPKPK